MEVLFYNNLSPNNSINKQLINSTKFDIVFKGDFNVENPVIKLKLDSPLEKNYVYIESEKKYFYIDSMTINNNKIYSYVLSLDVLMTFKDDILKAEGLVTRGTSGMNHYTDIGRLSETRKSSFIYKGDKTLKETENLIMIAFGQGGN